MRNDAYWGEKPAFGRMELKKVVPDELARANALRAGELDVISGDWVAALSPRRAKALEGEGMIIVAEPGASHDDPRLFAKVADDAGQGRAGRHLPRH